MPITTAGDGIVTSKAQPYQAEFASPSLQRSLTALSAFLVCLAVPCNLWFVFITFRGLFHSDAAMKVLLAEEIARTHSLFPPTWYYINDIPIIFPHVFVLGSRLIFHSYLLQHAVAVSAAVLLFSVTLFLLGRQLGLRPTYALAVQAILLSGFSSFFAQVLFGEAAYLMLPAALLFITYLLVKTYSEGTHGRPCVGPLGALILIIALAVAGGSRGFLTISAPVLIAVSIFLILETQFLSVRPHPLVRTTCLIVGAVCLGTVIGFAANLVLIHYCRITYATVAAFAPFDQIGQHVIVLVQGWLMAGGSVPDPGDISALSTVRVITRLSATLIITFLPWFLLARYRARHVTGAAVDSFAFWRNVLFNAVLLPIWNSCSCLGGVSLFHYAIFALRHRRDRVL